MACVYILTNKTIPGLLKIGFTGGTAADRAAEISRGTGVPSPYTVHWFIETTTTSAAYAVEQAVHHALKRDRHNQAREFFTTSLPVAIDTIERTAYQHGAVANDLPLIARMLEEERQAAKRAAAQRAANEQTQREAAERHQREAPQREAAERAMRAQQEATAKRISRKNKWFWGSAVVVAFLAFDVYQDHKAQEKRAYEAQQMSLRAQKAARIQAARIQQAEEEKARFELAARARTLQVEKAKNDCEVLTAQANELRYGTGVKNTLTGSGYAAAAASYQQRMADIQLQSQASARANVACAHYNFMATK
jgi:hypothetical protein